MDLNLREKYRKTRLRNKNENKTSDTKNIKIQHFKGSMPSFSISRIHYNFENYLLSVNLKWEFLPFICFCCYFSLLFCSVLLFVFFLRLSVVTPVTSNLPTIRHHRMSANEYLQHKVNYTN